MEYKRTRDPTRPHEFRFKKKWEAEVIQAAVNEWSIDRALKRTEKTRPDVDRKRILFPRIGHIFILHSGLIKTMTEFLDDFADNTENKIEEIARKTEVDFLSDIIDRRHKLGWNAASLAADVRDATAGISDATKEQTEFETSVLQTIEKIPETTEGQA